MTARMPTTTAGTSFWVDLGSVGRACGIPHVATVDELESFRQVFAEAMADDQTWLIAGRVASGDSPYLPDKNLARLRDRFRAALTSSIYLAEIGIGSDC